MKAYSTLCYKNSVSWFLMFPLHNTLEFSEIIQVYSNHHCWSLRCSTMKMQILWRKLNKAYLELSTCLLLCSVKLPDGLLLETYLWKIFFRKQLIRIYFNPIDIWKKLSLMFWVVSMQGTTSTLSELWGEKCWKIRHPIWNRMLCLYT